MNAGIDREIYLEQLEGLVESKNGVTLVCKLNESLYGLKP